MIGITNISHNILYITAQWKSLLPCQMNIFICASFWAITFVFQCLTPSTLQEGMLLAPTLLLCTDISEKDLPMLKDFSKGSRRAWPGCPHQPVAIRWEDGLHSLHCCWWLPCSSAIGSASRSSNAHVSSFPPQTLSQAHPFVLWLFVLWQKLSILGLFPKTIFSSGNTAKQALLWWHLQEHLCIHRNIFAVTNTEYRKKYSRRSYRNSAVSKHGISELHVLCF